MDWGNDDILPEDLIVNQGYLFSKIKTICQFDSGFLYFPESPPKECILKKDYKILFLKKEKKLLLPLIFKNKIIAMAVLNGVTQHANSQYMIRYAELCVENLFLKRACELDPETGLLRRYNFLKILENEIKKINHAFASTKPNIFDYDVDFSANFALCIVKLKGIAEIKKKYGYETKRFILKEFSKKLKTFFPSNSHLAYLKIGEFAVIIPNCTKIYYEEILKSLYENREVYLHDIDLKIKMDFHTGIVFYPRDINTSFVSTSELERADLLLNMAYKCLEVAEELKISVCDIPQALEKGAKIIEYNTAKVKINIGKKLGVKEGQIFSIVSREFLYSKDVYFLKGEFLVVDVNEDESIGDLLYLRPDKEIKLGDRVVLNNKERYSLKKRIKEEGSLDLKSFLHLFENRKDDKFSLIIIGSNNQEIKDYFSCENSFSPLYSFVKFWGEYGSKSIILYLSSHLNPDQVLEISKQVYHNLNKKGFSPIIGIAYYPCLKFVKKDILSNVRLAFEHASLLKEEKIAIFDSTTITLKGDKHFRGKNFYLAIEEYKLALSLDPKNTIARNSLAICYTIIGEYSKAKEEFETLLTYMAEDPVVWYNYGCLMMKIKDIEKAKNCFKRCLRIDKSHVFSLLRLGQIAEIQGLTKKAKSLYNLVIKTNGNNLAYRFLANLLLKEEDREKAKQCLYKAISSNPSDPKSYYLLAKIYIEEQKNLDIAISFLKTSLALDPLTKKYKNLLDKAYGLQRISKKTTDLP